LEGNNNKIRVAADTLKDFSNNVLSEAVTTQAIVAPGIGNETVTIGSPGDGSISKLNVASISGTTTNDGNLTSVRLQLKRNSDDMYLSANNGDFTSEDPVDLTVTGTEDWTVNLVGVVFVEGSYTITASANDGADGGTTSASFAIDKTPPVLENCTPADGSDTAANNTSFVLRFSENVTGRIGKYFKVSGRIRNAEIRGCSDTYQAA
jgi:hypothetical protein